MPASSNLASAFHHRPVTRFEVERLVGEIEEQALYDPKAKKWVDVRVDNPALKRLIKNSVKV